MVVNVTVVGPFEEEEEATGVASDALKVKGEDRNDPGTVTIPQYRFNKTKQHTHPNGTWLLDDPYHEITG